MEKKRPTFPDALLTLQQINDELDRLKSTVESFLNDQENFALIPQIIKEAIKTNKGIVSLIGPL